MDMSARSRRTFPSASFAERAGALPQRLISGTSPSPVPLSRREILSAALAGVGLLAAPRGLRAAAADGDAVIRALAFDGDALLVARRTLSRSDDGGVAWTSLDAPRDERMLCLATHPDRSGRVVAGLAAGGVALSEDGGRSWEMRSCGLPDEALIAITVAAATPDTIYAAIRGDGLWRSEDAGRAWTFVMDRPWLANAEHDPTALASVDLATGMGGIWIYAGAEAGLTRVPDCFCRWQDVQPGDAMDVMASGKEPAPVAPLPAGEPILALVSAPPAPETLYAALPSGVWASHDAGLVWTRIAAGRATAVAAHPTDPEHLVAALDGGLMRSRDGGAAWTGLTVE